ncbi:hypothetical protein HanPI659440_Chr13g0516671 [Helianthus annuus]|nr:hypothetical protein HanPI659440_Chr13g0516671 [Helianthus annuus]
MNIMTFSLHTKYSPVYMILRAICLALYCSSLASTFTSYVAFNSFRTTSFCPSLHNIFVWYFFNTKHLENKIDVFT